MLRIKGDTYSILPYTLFIIFIKQGGKIESRIIPGGFNETREVSLIRDSNVNLVYKVGLVVPMKGRLTTPD